MRRANSYSQRYDKLGGLESVIDRFEAAMLSLGAIAAVVGYSKETVRSDIKRQIGEREFMSLMERRQKAWQALRDKSMDIPAAREYLEKRAREADEAAAAELRALSQTLGEMERACVRLSMTETSQGAFKYALANGRCVQIRVAVVSGTLKEHGFGFHRFKVTPAIARCPFAVFVLAVGDEILPFVFKTSDIERVRSLNLRYAAESKYDITRKSKYDYARDKWSILKSPVR